MNKLPLILLTLTSACAHVDEQTFVTPLDPDDWRWKQTPEATEIVVNFYNENIGGNLDSSMVDISWSEAIDCQDSPNQGINVHRKCLGGAHFSCDKIYLAAYDDDSISDSGLAHEILHCWLEQEYGNPNSTHDVYEWSYVNLANDYLRIQGF